MVTVDYAVKKIHDYFREKGLDTSDMSLWHLKDAIRHTRGSDEKTVQKWLKILKESGLIKEIAPGRWFLLSRVILH